MELKRELWFGRIGLLSDVYDQQPPRSGRVSPRFQEEQRNYRARKIKLYKNGDSWFGGIDYRFIPGKVITR